MKIDPINRYEVRNMIGDVWLSCSDYGLGIDHFYEEVCNVIDNEVPTLEPKEGYWIHTNSVLNCNLCGGGVARYVKYRYCPYCGAKMVKVVEKDEINQ